MDKFQSMAVFVEIAERGSLTAAADHLGKSLPNVVRMLATLETTLGVRLLNRSTRRIALTEEGRIYLERCRKILMDIDETERVVGRHQVEPAGTITVTAPVRFGEMHVVPAIVRFLAEYPQIEVKLLLIDRVVDLLEEGIDVAVRIAQLADSTLIAKTVGKVRQVVCGSPALLQRVGEPNHPELLSRLPCIRFTGISSSPQWLFYEGKRQRSVTVNGQLQCNQVKAVLDFCRAGLGFGLFLCYQVMPAVRRHELKIVLQDFEPDPIPLSLVYPQNRMLSVRIRSFVDWMATALANSLAVELPAIANLK